MNRRQQFSGVIVNLNGRLGLALEREQGACMPPVGKALVAMVKMPAVPAEKLCIH